MYVCEIVYVCVCESVCVCVCVCESVCVHFVAVCIRMYVFALFAKITWENNILKKNFN